MDIMQELAVKRGPMGSINLYPAYTSDLGSQFPFTFSLGGAVAQLKTTSPKCILAIPKQENQTISELQEFICGPRNFV